MRRIWIAAVLVFAVAGVVPLRPAPNVIPPRFVVPDVADVTIKTRETLDVKGATVSADIVRLKGAWQRRERIRNFPDARTPVTAAITIARCDERRILELNDTARTYAWMPIGDALTPLRRLQLARPRAPQALDTGPEVRITVDAVDTGERRPFGRYIARHVITTTTTEPSPGANTRANKTVQDGWYIDLPPIDCRDWGAQYSSMVLASAAPDRVRIEHRGTARRGFPVEQITRMRDGVMTERVELVELSDATLAPSLFDVPRGYRPALPRLTGGFDLTKPDTLTNRLENYWEGLTSWVRYVFRS